MSMMNGASCAVYVLMAMAALPFVVGIMHVAHAYLPYPHPNCYINILLTFCVAFAAICSLWLVVMGVFAVAVGLLYVVARLKKKQRDTTLDHE